MRGGILDVFSVSAGDPVRLEFWGDEIVSIRTFDVTDQRSNGTLQETHILPVDLRRPNTQEEVNENKSASLVEILPSGAILVKVGEWDIDADFNKRWARVSTLYDNLVDSGASPELPSHFFIPSDTLSDRLSRFSRIDLTERRSTSLCFNSVEPPEIDRDMGRLENYLQEGSHKGFASIILCENSGQLQRLEEIPEASKEFRRRRALGSVP